MNIYLLVEGKRTEMKVYPKWISFLVPELSKVESHLNIDKNNYYIFSGNGYPSLLENHLKNSIDDINDTGKYDYFILCLDADDQGIDNCKKEINDFIQKKELILNPKTKFEIVVQNICFETWFLANPKIYKKNPNDTFLQKCTTFYNVKKDDPELMGKLPDFEGSTSSFHFSYLRKLLAERNVSYTKKSANDVQEKYFLDELIKRNGQTNHIKSFQYFIDVCKKIRNDIIANSDNIPLS